ncbi:hypothetical protein ACGC1H_004985 [Rhizoctonia solani]
MLPKLTGLYLENLYLNFMMLILASITPQSYCLTLNPSELITQNRLVNWDTEVVDIEDVHRLLSRYSIHKLILSDGTLDWATGRDLRKFLRAVPNLKALIMNFYTLDNKLFKVLEPPSATRNIPFPQLETLEFRGSTVPGDITRLKKLVTKHPLQRLVLGQRTFPDGSHELDINLTENAGAVKWLKATVPGFLFIPHDIDPPECTDVVWLLWDI